MPGLSSLTTGYEAALQCLVRSDSFWGLRPTATWLQSAAADTALPRRPTLL